MLTDDDLHARLHAAGERFRARTSEPAPLNTRRRPRRRLLPALAGAASVAVVVGLVVGITQLTGRSTPHGAAAPGHATPIAGVHWQLVAAADARDRPVPVSRQVALFIHDGTVSANDGCNAIGGPVQLVGGEGLRFGNLISTTMGCLDAGAQERVVDAVLRGTVSFRIDAGRLTITKPGSGELTYTALKPTPPPTTPPDPAALAPRRWLLDSVERTGDGSTSSENVTTGYVLVFDARGGFRLTEVCGEMVGLVAARGSALVFSQQRFVARGCTNTERAQAMTVQSVFARANWTLDDDGARLTLSTSDTRLVFRG